MTIEINDEVFEDLPVEKRQSVSEEQKRVLLLILDWAVNQPKKQEFCLDACAGSGKTHIALLLNYFESIGQVIFSAYTNKATGVLAAKSDGECPATTVFSLIYRPGRRVNEEQVAAQEEKLKKLKEAKKPNAEKITKVEAKIKKLKQGFFIGVEKEYSVMEDYCITIVDEASMINKRDAAALRKLGNKILYIGDLMQLQPVISNKIPPKEKPLYERYLDYTKVDASLDEVHRQKADSGVLRIAGYVRRKFKASEDSFSFTPHMAEFYNKLPDVSIKPLKGFDTRCLEKYRDDSIGIKGGFDRNTHLVTFENKDRIALNNMIRKEFVRPLMDDGRYDPLPVAGDKLECRTTQPFNRQDPDAFRLMTGLFCEVRKVWNAGHKNAVRVLLRFETGVEKDMYIDTSLFYEEMTGKGKVIVADRPLEYDFMPIYQFPRVSTGYGKDDTSAMTPLFRYAYATTVHSAQGSEWDNVVLYDNKAMCWSSERYNFIYTAITRARKNIEIYTGDL